MYRDIVNFDVSFTKAPLSMRRHWCCKVMRRPPGLTALLVTPPSRLISCRARQRFDFNAVGSPRGSFRVGNDVRVDIALRATLGERIELRSAAHRWCAQFQSFDLVTVWNHLADASLCAPEDHLFRAEEREAT
jgi:hypothetical protein